MPPQKQISSIKKKNSKKLIKALKCWFSWFIHPPPIKHSLFMPLLENPIFGSFQNEGILTGENVRDQSTVFINVVP